MKELLLKEIIPAMMLMALFATFVAFWFVNDATSPFHDRESVLNVERYCK